METEEFGSNSNCESSTVTRQVEFDVFLNIFNKFVNLSRKPYQEIKEYITDFEAKYSELEKVGGTMPLNLLTSFLLKNANLSTSELHEITLKLNFSLNDESLLSQLFTNARYLLNEHKAMDNNVLVQTNDSALNKAAEEGDVKKCLTLINSGFNVNSTYGSYKSTPLHCASIFGRLDVVKLLLDKGL